MIILVITYLRMIALMMTGQYDEIDAVVIPYGPMFVEIIVESIVGMVIAGTYKIIRGLFGS